MTDVPNIDINIEQSSNKNDDSLADSAQSATYIERLAKKIARYQKSYYRGEGEISDAEFDALWDELKRIAPEHPILKAIGSDIDAPDASIAPSTDASDLQGSSATPTIAAQNSPDTSGAFTKARHIMMMGSQEKASDPNQFLQWAQKHAYDEYLVEYKLDGASLELQYQNGTFTKAVTRGDGTIGEDITQNALKMNGVVRSIDKTFTGAVRGEVIMSHAVHRAYFGDKANCRNAANGLMKRKDGSGSEYLEIICYDAFYSGTESAPFGDTPFGDTPFGDEMQKMEWLTKNGFTCVPVKICATASDVIDYRAHVMEIRPSLPYDIDGLVIKNRAIDIADSFRARPDKQIAFKFSLEEAVTVLRRVVWNENGATYTPIGEFDTVELAGTKVRRASLVNPNTIEALGICIGSHVVVTKRGEIIPKIEAVVKEYEESKDEKTLADAKPDAQTPVNQTPDSKESHPLNDLPLFSFSEEASVRVDSSASGAPLKETDGSSANGAPLKKSGDSSKPHLVPIPIPKTCGTCGATLVNEGTRLYCPNRDCSKRLLHQISKWISVIDIRDLGETLIRSLFASGDVTSVTDLYRLNEATLTRRFLNEESIEKEKVSLGARKVLASIQKSRTMNLASFIAGFDIEGIGQTMAEKLVSSGFDTLEKMLSATERDIASVYGFADISAHTFVQGLNENRTEMQALVSSGTIQLKDESIPGALSGKSFCFTGELYTLKRLDAEKLVKEKGGTCKSSVTKDLSFLVTNDTQSGSSKNKKAQTLGIPIIDEQQFLELVT